MSKAQEFFKLCEDDDAPPPVAPDADPAAAGAPPAADPNAAPGAEDPRMHKFADLHNDMLSLKEEVEQLMNQFQAEDPQVLASASAIQKRMGLIVAKLEQIADNAPPPMAK